MNTVAHTSARVENLKRLEKFFAELEKEDVDFPEVAGPDPALDHPLLAASVAAANPSVGSSRTFSSSGMQTTETSSESSTLTSSKAPKPNQ
jgi:hypothetical protein